MREYNLSEYIKDEEMQNKDNISIKITNIEEYEKLIHHIKNKNINIIVDNTLLQQILLNEENNIQDINFTIEISDMSQLDSNKLEKLRNKIKLNRIKIVNNTNLYEEDYYSIDEYIELHEQIHNIIKYTDNSQSELEKFLTIYKIIGDSIIYDDYLNEFNKTKPSDWNENQSMIRRTIIWKNSLCRIFKDS